MLLAILWTRLKKDEKFLSYVTEGGICLVSRVGIFTNLTGATDEVKKWNFYVENMSSVHPSVTQYQSLNHSSDFHEIPCKLSLKKTSSERFMKTGCDRHTLLTDAYQFLSALPILWLICIKLGIQSLHVMPSNSCNFHESGRSRIKWV